MKNYPKFVAVSKTAKAKNEIIFTIDTYNNVAINVENGKTQKIDSIKKNYNVIRPLPCTPEEFGRAADSEEEATMENYNEYMKQFNEVAEVAEIEDQPEVEETIEETVAEPAADETNEVKTEDEALIEIVAELNGVETTDVAAAEPKTKKAPEVLENFEAFPFGIEGEKTVTHKKIGEAKEYTFHYNNFTLVITCDPNSNGVKPVKRGCHVTGEVKGSEDTIIKTTSMTKALKAMEIPEEEIKRAKKTIELAKHNHIVAE